MTRRGFSLIEVIVSGALIATTVGGLFAVASMSMRMTTLSQDRSVATQLAREGIEAIRQVRDTNFVSTNCAGGAGNCADWLSGIPYNGNPVVISIAPDTNRGFILSSHNTNSGSSLNADDYCSDYLARKVKTGELYSVSHHQWPEVTEPVQQYCRRVFIEPVKNTDLLPSGITSSESLPEGLVPIDPSGVIKDAIRVRSQVSWLGYGRTQWRTFEDLSSVTCPTKGDATEWCVEQTTILTNWRPQL